MLSILEISIHELKLLFFHILHMMFSENLKNSSLSWEPRGRGGVLTDENVPLEL